MKLYALIGACSLVPHTALIMTKADYQYNAISREYSKSAEYLAKNPQGAVPLLEDGDFALSQNVAIINYLNTKFPQAHLFGNGDDKQQAIAQQWLSFVNSDVHKAFTPLFRPTVVLSEAELTDTIKLKVANVAKEHVLALYGIANDNLADKAFLAGEFSIADVYLYVTLRWATMMGFDLSKLNHIQKLIQNVQAQSVVEQALQEEGLEKI